MAERELTAEELATLEDAAARNHPDAPEREVSPEELAALSDAASRVHIAAPPAPPKAEDPGAWDALWRSVGAGSMKQGLDELTGEIAQLVAGRDLSPEDKNELYRRARDRQRALLEAGREAHPVLSFLGNMAGDVGSDYLLSKAGVPVTSTPYQAAVGGLSGLLGSKAELTSDKGTPADVLRAGVDAGTGAAASYLIPKVGQRIAQSSLGRAVGSRVRQALENRAVALGRRVIGGDSDIAAATRQALPDEAVLKVLEEGLIKPGSTTASTYKRIDEAAEAMGASYGAILKRLEELGVTGPRATALAAEFMRRANELRAGSMPRNTAPSIMAEMATDLGRHGENDRMLPLSVAENLKRDAQRMGRHERITNSPGEQAYQEIGSRLRQGIEDEVEAAGAAARPGSEVEQLASEFKPIKSSLGQLLAARTVGERGASKALSKSPVSIKDYVLGATMGDPGGAALAALASSAARNRLPSTGAAALYGLSRGSGRGAVSAGAKAALHQPETIQALTDWLAGDDKKRRQQALLQALTQEQNP